MSFQGLLKTFDRKRCFEGEIWERERWNIIAFIHFSELGEREASLEGDLPYQCSIKFPMKLSTRHHCVLHYLLYSFILCVPHQLHCVPYKTMLNWNHPDFLGQERNNIQDFYPWSISGNKIHYRFRFRFQCHHRAKEKWSDSENLKLWSAFVWRYNLSSLTKWLIVLKPFLLSSFSIHEVFSLKFGF